MLLRFADGIAIKWNLFMEEEEKEDAEAKVVELVAEDKVDH